MESFTYKHGASYRNGLILRQLCQSKRHEILREEGSPRMPLPCLSNHLRRDVHAHVPAPNATDSPVSWLAVFVLKPTQQETITAANIQDPLPALAGRFREALHERFGARREGAPLGIMSAAYRKPAVRSEMLLTARTARRMRQRECFNNKLPPIIEEAPCHLSTRQRLSKICLSPLRPRRGCRVPCHDLKRVV